MQPRRKRVRLCVPPRHPGGSGAYVEHLIADGNANASFVPGGTKYSKGQVLNREVASSLIGAFDPRPHCGVIRFVGAGVHEVFLDGRSQAFRMSYVWPVCSGIRPSYARYAGLFLRLRRLPQAYAVGLLSFTRYAGSNG